MERKATTELGDGPNLLFLQIVRRLDHYHNKGSGKCLSPKSKRVSLRKITIADIEMIHKIEGVSVEIYLGGIYNLSFTSMTR